MAIINGTIGDDTLVNTSGNDSINGNGGNDTITVTGGQDNVITLGGNDRLVVDYSLIPGSITSSAPSAVANGFSGSFSSALGTSVSYNGINHFTVITGL